MIAATNTPAVLAAKAATKTIPTSSKWPATRSDWASLPALTSRAVTLRVSPNERGYGAEAAAIAARAGPHRKGRGPSGQPSQSHCSETQLREVRSAARTLGLDLHVLNASTESDFEVIFANLIQLRAGGLVIAADPLFAGRSKQLGN